MPKSEQKLQLLIKKVNAKAFRKWYFLFIAIFSITYLFFLSPLIEPYIQDSIFSIARNSQEEKYNFLTPVYAKSDIASRYSLSVVRDGTSLDEIRSRTRYYIQDPRVLAMSEFLYAYNSPMYPHAELFVTEADKYGLDWRLIVAISGVESAFGNLIPRDSHNAWGWRGRNPNDRGWSMFEDWEEAIIHITERMALGYGTDLTPFQIQNTYCPPCGRSGRDLWAHGVTRFMNELNYYLNNLGSM